MSSSGVIELVYFDGGVLETEPQLQAEYNEVVLYEDSQLPGFGFVIQNTTRIASGFDIYANMVSLDGNVVFVNRLLELTSRQALDPYYVDDDPVIILWLASGDVATGGRYNLQFRAVSQTAVTAVEYFPELLVRILPRVVSGA